MNSNSPFTPYPASQSYTPSQSPTGTPVSTPSTRGRPKGATTGTGAKRGRKPRGGGMMGTSSPRMSQETFGSTASPVFSNTQFSHVHWAVPTGGGSGEGSSGSGAMATGTSFGISANGSGGGAASLVGQQSLVSQEFTAQASPTPSGRTTSFSLPTGSGSSVPTLDTTGLISLSGVNAPVLPTGSAAPVLGVRPQGGDEDGEGEDELLPAMADDDYSAQLSWQSQSKDNLKVLMDNFSAAQYDRFEAYRRHALPKQAVRKVIQQHLGQQISQPVAQIVAGFAKVFVGEMVEKARAVQTRRGEAGPLSPDHLREAYRLYQEETGRVGAARPLSAKRLFMR